MTRLLAQLLILVAACVGAAPAYAVKVNPIFPDLPLDNHAFSLCNFIAGGGDPASARCNNENVTQDPITMNQIRGKAEASADLKKGILKARAKGQAHWFGPSQLNADGNALAQLYDTITVGNGYSGRVEVRMAVSGGFSSTPESDVTGSNAHAFLFGVDDDGVPTDSVFIDAEPFSDGDGAFTNGVRRNGRGEGHTNANSNGRFASDDVEFLLRLFFEVSPESPTFSFSARLNAGGALSREAQTSRNRTRESEVDFGHTAHVSIIAPDGVEWSSGSGVFLTPEPSLTALALVPFALLGACRARGCRAR